MVSNIQPFSKQRITIVGAGISGQAVARLLYACGAEVCLLERETSRIPEAFRAWAEEVGVTLLSGEHTEEHFITSDIVVPCPGVATATLQPLLPADGSVQILAETEVAWLILQTLTTEQTHEKIIGITGSNGKTTTTSLCAAMLQEQGYTVFVGGNIGKPLSEYVLERLEHETVADVLVLELSSFQLQTCKAFRPDIAMLLNVSENHLDFHADMEEYTVAKMQLFANQQVDDIAIFGAELVPLAEGFEVAARCEYIEGSIIFSESQLFGVHNQLNAEAAWLAARALGVTEANARRAVAAFQPIVHRLQRVAEYNNVLFVNDSKASTTEALRMALTAFDRPILLLAGGKYKGGDPHGLRDLIQQHVRHVALFGGAKDVFTEAWADIVSLTWDETLEQAMLRLYALAQSNDVVLLAPATSSFDQYINYTFRGNDFIRIVQDVIPHS